MLIAFGPVWPQTGMETPVQNLTALWSTLDTRRRAIVAGATVLAFVAVLFLARLSGAPQMALLYSGLVPAAAGDVVAALESRGVAHEVRGDAIHVDAARRDSLRMELAAEGLPAASAKGYELLDGLTGFGTTAQMFDSAQWRAVEGELARTILAASGVRAARVHLARAPSRIFADSTPPTASVAITPASGRVTPAQAQAIRHLVAAAVAGLSPDAVQVIDSVYGLVEPAAATVTAQAADRAEAIRQNVARLLAARVGQGRAVVEVSVDLVTETEEITERRFDPEGRVAIATESQSQSGSDTQPGGPVTVASNLPEGEGQGSGPTSTSQESRERVNYEVSETRRDLRRVPGDIRRLSVAVLVDSAESVAEDGTVTRTARSEDELATLKELVASAAGIDAARGDVLTLHSMEFRPEPETGTLAESGWLAAPLDMMKLAQIAALALVALVTALFVIRPILMAAPRGPSAPVMPLALPAAGGAALTGVIDDDAHLPDLQVVGSNGQVAEDPVVRLRRLISERQAESVEILRGWMEAEEKG